jgi:hypothetical protein
MPFSPGNTFNRVRDVIPSRAAIDAALPTATTRLRDMLAHPAAVAAGTLPART